MSIAAKQMLMRDIEKTVGSFLTVTDTNQVMQLLSEQIGMFEIEQTTVAAGGVESTELLTAYLDAKRVEGRSSKTIDRYEYILTRVFNAIGVPTKKISVFHLRKYFADEKDRGISDSTLDGTRQVLSAYFGWLLKEGLISQDPTVNLNPIKCIKKVRKPYSPVDIEKLKECCDNDRDKAIISLLLSSGCRISEICGLNRDSVDFVAKEILVLGKGNKERTVFIDDVTVMLLNRYLKGRGDLKPALFVGKGSDRLTPGGIRKMLKMVAAKAGVDNTHPHRFRRTLATNLIDHGMSIQEVAAILGHEKIDTTMKYVYIDKNNVRNSYQKYAC